MAERIVGVRDCPYRIHEEQYTGLHRDLYGFVIGFVMCSCFLEPVFQECPAKLTNYNRNKSISSSQNLNYDPLVSCRFCSKPTSLRDCNTYLRNYPTSCPTQVNNTSTTTSENLFLWETFLQTSTSYCTSGRCTKATIIVRCIISL